MFCINCGQQLSGAARFCTGCGNAVAGGQSSAASSPPAVQFGSVSRETFSVGDSSSTYREARVRTSSIEMRNESGQRLKVETIAGWSATEVPEVTHTPVRSLAHPSGTGARIPMWHRVFGAFLVVGGFTLAIHSHNTISYYYTGTTGSDFIGVVLVVLGIFFLFRRRSA